jgi:hypothetical protein
MHSDSTLSPHSLVCDFFSHLLLYDSINENDSLFFLGLLLFSFVSDPISHLVGLAMNFLSRQFEVSHSNFLHSFPISRFFNQYEADRFATDLDLELSQPVCPFQRLFICNNHAFPWVQFMISFQLAADPHSH